MTEPLNWVQQMHKEEEDAKLMYAEIMESTKDKTYLDILPKGFNKTSIIGKNILKVIDESHIFFNSSPLYKGKVFDKKDILQFMMRGRSYSNFYLSFLFIPRVDSMDLSMKFFDTHRDLKEENKEQWSAEFDQYHKDHKDEYKLYNDVDWQMRRMESAWESYANRQAVKNHTIEIDMEGGWPRNGRGNMCVAFYPIKGDISELQIGSVYDFTNPRSKKMVELMVLAKKDSKEPVYRCLLKGKEIYITPYDEVQSGWEPLFPINKQIYSGWWNRTLIFN